MTTAQTIPSGLLLTGDVLSLGGRFYRVEGNEPYMLGYHRVLLRNMDDSQSCGVYEFRQDTYTTVLRTEEA